MNQPTSFKKIQKCHTFSTNGLKPHVDLMPPWFRDQIGEVEKRYEFLKDLYYEKERHDIDMEDARKTHMMWEEESEDMIKSVYYTLKAKNDENLLNFYFEKNSPSKLNNSSMKVEFLGRILEVSEHHKREELDDFIDSLTDLHDRGRELLKLKTNTTIRKKSKGRLLSDARKSWYSQYRRVKTAMKAYFHESSIDYRDFFLDTRPRKIQPDDEYVVTEAVTTNSKMPNKEMDSQNDTEK